MISLGHLVIVVAASIIQVTQNTELRRSSNEIVCPDEFAEYRCNADNCSTVQWTAEPFANMSGPSAVSFSNSDNDNGVVFRRADDGIIFKQESTHPMFVTTATIFGTVTDSFDVKCIGLDINCGNASLRYTSGDSSRIVQPISNLSLTVVEEGCIFSSENTVMVQFLPSSSPDINRYNIKCSRNACAPLELDGSRRLGNTIEANIVLGGGNHEVNVTAVNRCGITSVAITETLALSRYSSGCIGSIVAIVILAIMTCCLMFFFILWFLIGSNCLKRRRHRTNSLDLSHKAD